MLHMGQQECFREVVVAETTLNSLRHPGCMNNPLKKKNSLPQRLA